MSWGGQAPQQNPYYGQGQGYGQAPPPQQAGYGQQPGGGYGAPGGYGGAPPGGPPPQGVPPQGVPPQGVPPQGVPPQGVPPQGVPGGYGAPPPGQYGSQPRYGAPPAQNPAYGGPPPQGGQPHQGYGGHGGYGAPQGPPAPPGVSPELWHWFQAVDADRSGQITAIELQTALMNGNWTPFNPETCRLMIGMFDRDKTGTIDIHEFSALWKYIQDWKACFDRFDTDRSGNINSQELNNAFRTFGYNLSPNFCNMCVRVFDKHSMNTMNFDNFIQCCVMLKSLTATFQAKDTQRAGTIRIHYEEFLKMVLENST